MVIVNLYPFEETIAKPGVTDEEAIEKIDIGGPSMLRSAAKNHKSVTVVCDPADYNRVLEGLRNKNLLPDLRRELALKVGIDSSKIHIIFPGIQKPQIIINDSKTEAKKIFGMDNEVSGYVINSKEQAKKIIIKGGIIVYPTDTLYGFGVDATNENSINQLNKLKNRTGPISVIAPDKNVVSTWIDIPTNEKDKALENLTPHRTIIYPVRKKVVNSLILGPDNTLGIRIPAHPFCISLAKQCNVPITTTSVNRKGEFPKSNTNDLSLIHI